MPAEKIDWASKPIAIAEIERLDDEPDNDEDTEGDPDEITDQQGQQQEILEQMDEIPWGKQEVEEDEQ